jgi:hypothetical protein
MSLNEKEELSIRGFHKQLLAAARLERDKGNITQGQCSMVRALQFRPLKLREAYKLAIAEGVKAGVVPADVEGDNEEARTKAMAIDWQQLFDFLVKILPLILQIIAIFA